MVGSSLASGRLACIAGASARSDCLFAATSNFCRVRQRPMPQGSARACAAGLNWRPSVRLGKTSLTTVERAARLIIEEGALDGRDNSVDHLAERLGVTSRHLRRLFVRHWGASPSGVAQTARIQRAKRLLDTTTLPISEIALASGFGSLRRFNAVFAGVYHRQPSEIRRSMRTPSGHLNRSQRPNRPASVIE